MGLAYETFAPEAEAAPPGPSAEWTAGHAAGHAKGLATGLAAGAEAAAARAEALSADLAQALADTAFGYAEARGQVLAALGPLFAALADALLPALAAAALAPWLVQALRDAAAADTRAPLLVHVHPDRLVDLRALMPPGGPATLAPDPTLGPHDARLARAGAETALDLGACLDGLRTALAALQPPEGTARHA